MASFIYISINTDIPSIVRNTFSANHRTLRLSFITCKTIRSCGKRLRDEDGADVLIMGCAGMANYRDILEVETGLPVIDPCQAAAAMALGQIALGLSHKGTAHA